jgi:hypothetical protein
MRRLAPIIALAALTVMSAPAPAGAAEVGPQVERQAPSKYPADLGGCKPRCVRGRTIHRGYVLLSRRVRLDPGDRSTRVTFRCPGRRVFHTFGFLESGDVLLQIPQDQFPYNRRTRIRAVAERGLSPVQTVARGTVYALCKPR